MLWSNLSEIVISANNDTTLAAFYKRHIEKPLKTIRQRDKHCCNNYRVFNKIITLINENTRFRSVRYLSSDLPNRATGQATKPLN